MGPPPDWSQYPASHVVRPNTGGHCASADSGGHWLGGAAVWFHEQRSHGPALPVFIEPGGNPGQGRIPVDRHFIDAPGVRVVHVTTLDSTTRQATLGSGIRQLGIGSARKGTGRWIGAWLALGVRPEPVVRVVQRANAVAETYEKPRGLTPSR